MVLNGRYPARPLARLTRSPVLYKHKHRLIRILIEALPQGRAFEFLPSPAPIHGKPIFEVIRKNDLFDHAVPFCVQHFPSEMPPRTHDRRLLLILLRSMYMSDVYVYLTRQEL